MVAISLYRGNLHRVSDVPRRWLMPNPKLNLKDFRSLLQRRSKALSRLSCSSSAAAASADAATTSTPNPNPNPKENGDGIQLQPQLEPEEINMKQKEKVEDSNPEGEQAGADDSNAVVCKAVEEDVRVAEGEKPDGGDSSAKPEEDGGAVEQKPDADEKGGEEIKDDETFQLERPDEPANSNPEMAGKVDMGVSSGKETRKKEIEEKLQVLNGKKHNLVQVLKQILNVEEELKRRNSMQGMARPSVPLQVDVTMNDSGSISRQVTPRMGSDANVGVDNEGGEGDDLSNHHIHSRHLHRMSSTSPSSESPLRRPPFIQHNVPSHPSRSSIGATSSPSRFAPTGHQGHPANMPTVSVSGTNYIASSPSPAASGGTSAFRDARHPSPWN